MLYERTLDFDGEPGGAYEPASRGSYMAFNSDPVATEDYIAVPYLDKIKGRDRGGMTEIQFWSWDCELLHRLIFDKSFTNEEITLLDEKIKDIIVNKLKLKVRS